MRLVVFFDLPVTTASDRREYRCFVKYLEKNGFIRLQESVFSKLSITERIATSDVMRLAAARPPEGLVQVLKITEKQFATMRTIVGSARDGIELDDTDDLVII